MIKFLMLLLVALIVFPIALFFIKKINLQTKLVFLIGGFVTALIGLLVQSSLSLYYSLFIMLGLVFVGAVMVAKQVENKLSTNIKSRINSPEIISITKQQPLRSSVVHQTVEGNENEHQDWLKPAGKENF